MPNKQHLKNGCLTLQSRQVGKNGVPECKSGLCPFWVATSRRTVHGCFRAVFSKLSTAADWPNVVERNQ